MNTKVLNKVKKIKNKLDIKNLNKKLNNLLYNYLVMKEYISTKIKDYLKPYLRQGNKTENMYLKTIFSGIIKGKLSTLTEIGRKNDKQVGQFVKNISKFLKRWEIIKYEVPYFRRIDKQINGRYIILYDETDINK